jgi:hypothetical protein
MMRLHVGTYARLRVRGLYLLEEQMGWGSGRTLSRGG